MKRTISLILVICASMAFGADAGLSIPDILKKVQDRLNLVADTQIIENFSGGGSVIISLSDEAYAKIRDASASILGKPVPKNISVRMKFVATLDKGNLANVAVSGTGDIGGFLFIKKGDWFNCFLPELKVEISDTFSGIKGMFGKPAVQDTGIKEILGGGTFKKFFPEFAKMFSTASVSRDARNGFPVFILEAVDSKGTPVRLIVYEDTSTIAEFSGKNQTDTFYLLFDRPQNKQNVDIRDYIPTSLILEHLEKGNRVRIEVGGISYNRANITSKDFDIQKMTLMEFAAFLYVKSLPK